MHPAIRVILAVAAKELLPVVATYVQKKLSPRQPVQITIHVTKPQ